MSPAEAKEHLSSFRGRLVGADGFDENDFEAIDLAIRMLSPAALPSKPPTSGRRRLALLIGTNYTGTAEQLGQCVNDVMAWKQHLSALGFQVTTITAKGATRQVIMAVLDELVRTANADLFFQWSGHGVQVPDRSGDEPDSRDEAICPDNFRQAGVITDDQIGEIVSRLASNSRLVMLLDSCHSGTASRDAASDWRPRSIAWDDSIPLPPSTRSTRAADSARVALLAACQDDETAAETGRGGAFTEAMLTTWRASGTVREWVSRAGSRLRSQHPVASGMDVKIEEFFG